MHTSVGSVRAPFCRDTQEVLTEGFFIRPVQFIQMDHRVLYAPVVYRKDIFPSKGKHQQHLRRPAAYSFYLCEAGDDRFVVHLMEGLMIHSIVDGKLRHILYI